MRAISWHGWRTVVRPTGTRVEYRTSSKPTTAKSSGTRTPSSAKDPSSRYAVPRGRRPGPPRGPHEAGVGGVALDPQGVGDGPAEGDQRFPYPGDAGVDGRGRARVAQEPDRRRAEPDEVRRGDVPGREVVEADEVIVAAAGEGRDVAVQQHDRDAHLS
jgi:hypothetical protein